MKYNTVRLNTSTYKFEVYLGDGKDRVKVKTKPMVDFYHYPETISNEDAVYELYQHVTKSITDQMDSLQDRLNKVNQAYEAWRKENERQME